MERHPGINIARIAVKNGAGLIFVVGVLLIFLAGIPETRWFLLLSVLGGVMIGIALYLWHKLSQ
jgi:hypothetical protein